MTYPEYNLLEQEEPYVLRIDGPGGGLLYFGSRHTTDPADPQIDSIRTLWAAFAPTVALAEARKTGRRSTDRRSDGQAAELIRERGRWPGLEGTMRSVADMDSIWRRELPNGPDWRTLPWQSTWPNRDDTWLNAVSADVNRFRDQYMVALIETLVANGERVFAVVGSSHVVMQEEALQTMLRSNRPR